jgi:hypothetical protein
MIVTSFASFFSGVYLEVQDPYIHENNFLSTIKSYEVSNTDQCLGYTGVASYDNS